MTMKTLSFLPLLALGLLFASGCTHTAKMRVASGARIQNSASGKIPLHICLVLRPEFRSYEYKFENMGDTWVYPFGQTAQDQAVSLCQQTFANVSVSTNHAIPQGVDAVLDPEVLRTGYAISAGKFDFTLRLEWILRDSQNQNILWATTIDGKAIEKQKKVFQKLFDELANQSHQAFVESEEIHRLVASLGRTHPANR